MVNIVIYLEEEMQEKASELVYSLLNKELVASASIDEENSYYIRIEGKVVKTSHKVITAQTKSLMFTDIVELVKEQIGENVPVFSVPLTQMNDHFNEYIKSRTKKV